MKPFVDRAAYHIKAIRAGATLPVPGNRLEIARTTLKSHTAYFEKTAEQIACMLDECNCVNKNGKINTAKLVKEITERPLRGPVSKVDITGSASALQQANLNAGRDDDEITKKVRREQLCGGRDLFPERIKNLAENLAATLIEKNKSYADSWRRRGGIDSFMMLARKWDRIENIVKMKYAWNILNAAKDNEADIRDDIKDLAAYCLLVLEYTTR